MKYEGITWGPSMRGYLADNKTRIGRVEKSLASLKNQTGQFAHDHRMLIEVYREIGAVLIKHIELADALATVTPAERVEKDKLSQEEAAAAQDENRRE
jgi:hypothetical protein